MSSYGDFLKNIWGNGSKNNPDKYEYGFGANGSDGSSVKDMGNMFKYSPLESNPLSWARE